MHLPIFRYKQSLLAGKEVVCEIDDRRPGLVFGFWFAASQRLIAFIKPEVERGLPFRILNDPADVARFAPELVASLPSGVGEQAEVGTGLLGLPRFGGRGRLWGSGLLAVPGARVYDRVCIPFLRERLEYQRSHYLPGNNAN